MYRVGKSSDTAVLASIELPEKLRKSDPYLAAVSLLALGCRPWQSLRRQSTRHLQSSVQWPHRFGDPIERPVAFEATATSKGSLRLDFQHMTIYNSQCAAESGKNQVPLESSLPAIASWTRIEISHHICGTFLKFPFKVLQFHHWISVTSGFQGLDWVVKRADPLNTMGNVLGKTV